MTLNVNKIKALLAEKKLSCYAFSQKCGISRQSISRIFKRGTCRYATAGKLAEALEVSVLEIIKEEEK